MKALYRKIHSSFRLNGIAYSFEDLQEVAYNLVKEGEHFEKTMGDFLLDWTDDHPTLKAKTSGSTGKPRPITLRKEHMVNSALATGEFFGLQPGDSALLCLPVDYIAGKMMLVRALVLGLELDVVFPSSNPLADISKTYDFCAMIPLQLQNSLVNMVQIKTLIVGGAPISRTFYPKIQSQLKAQEYKTQFFETYGMTETITHIALKKLNAAVDRGEVKNKNSFKTLPHISLTTDDRGCLVIDAPKVIDAPIITNDVVDLLSETEFEWLGRYDNVINSGGIKLFPEQIEDKLASVISSRFFVAGLPDEQFGQKLVLVVEGEIDKEKLYQAIKSVKALEKFETPKEIFPVEEFQKTDSGKIQRNKTLALALE